ncbi:IS110 family transposase [Oceanirhabdus sp. W0125-5]|uniref:IS110 family transposase n=1 Tax=Oceanirhabdus sp. W0125-5 TaxID=2999116 RepID=UPI0022F2BC49|nr:transposase [Oceanirhabdus sp. W0125-5]WBW95938.1 transposase [Oceanirhabdus sp. W0125-5]
MKQHYKQSFVYVGVDLHKGSHTAVVIDCWNEKLLEITIENKPSAFGKLLKNVTKVADGLDIIWGLEDVGGYGRSLAVYLLEKKQMVKEVNSALSYAQRMSNPTTMKSDSWDAYCIACTLISRLKSLPDANPQDIYWTLGQLVSRRDALVKSKTALVNQLHSQLSHSYPSYRKFFSDTDGQTALVFWGNYPSPHHLEDVTLEDLTGFLRIASKNTCSTRKAKEILKLVKEDGETKREYQESRDFIVTSIVRDITFSVKEISKVEDQMKKLKDILGYKLDTMPGIAHIKFSSAGKGDYKKSKQGNRDLHGIFYFLAVQQVQVSRGTKIPRNPAFYDYYQRKIKEGKTKMQALVCIMRRLVNIIFGMMKNKTAYIMPVVEEPVAV